MRLHIPALEDLKPVSLHHLVPLPPDKIVPYTAVDVPTLVPSLPYQEIFEMRMTFASRVAVDAGSKGGNGSLTAYRLRYDLVHHVYGGLVDGLSHARRVAIEEGATATVEAIDRMLEPLKSLVDDASK